MPDINAQIPTHPPLFARVSPPQEVVTSVAAVRAACNSWELTKIGADTPLSFSSEAELCDQLTGRTHPAETSFGVGVSLGVAGTLVVICIVTVLRDIYRGLRCLIRRRIERTGITPVVENRT
jgi:hypothetical protein